MKILENPILVLIGIIVAVVLTLLAHELDRKIQPPYYHASTDSYD